MDQGRACRLQCICSANPCACSGHLYPPAVHPDLPARPSACIERVTRPHCCPSSSNPSPCSTHGPLQNCEHSLKAYLSQLQPYKKTLPAGVLRDFKC